MFFVVCVFFDVSQLEYSQAIYSNLSDQISIINYLPTNSRVWHSKLLNTQASFPLLNLVELLVFGFRIGGGRGI